jgi:lysophospholipase L1-like esterase
MGWVVESTSANLPHRRLKSPLTGENRDVRGTGRAVGLVAVVAALLTPATASADYVALGDSYTAGPLIPLQIAPYGCLKSDRNYAHLAAPRLAQPAFRDPSCSGAETEDMTQPQGVTPGPNPPQFDALDADTQIVTFTIGGNDIGFTSIAESCLSASPIGTYCKGDYVHDGRDEISERIAATAPKVAAVIQGIRARAPQARIFALNYAAIFPERGFLGCWPQLPVASGDIAYLREKQKELNAMIAAQAAANGAGLIDWYAASIGHDACKPPGLRWVEPLIPANAAAPVHPNLLGMIGAADLVVTAADRSRR